MSNVNGASARGSVEEREPLEMAAAELAGADQCDLQHANVRA
jgi:hypothetical protein